MGKELERKIPAQRRAEIRALLGLRGSASISEISDALGVSGSTVRRDLDELDRDGMVRRSHGGAVTVEGTAFEHRFEDRRRHNPGEKKRIGDFAATLLEAGQSVVFDSSSTVLAAAEAPGLRKLGVTAVTNDVGIASVLAEGAGASVVVPGGEVRDGSFTLLGPYTQTFLNGLHVDVAFVGIHAVTGDVLSDSSLDVVEAKRSMMRAARRVVLLADGSKFGQPSFLEVARLDAVDDLVTDDTAPPEALEAVETSGVRVHLV